jgi:hypothetical protein
MLLHLSRYSGPSTPILSTGNIFLLFSRPWLFEKIGQTWAQNGQVGLKKYIIAS